MVHVLRQYGYSIVFLAVFAEDLDLPLPSYPLILVGTALAADLHFPLGGIVVGSIVAAFSADQVWYVLGRLCGHPIRTQPRGETTYRGGHSAGSCLTNPAAKH